MLIPIIPRRRSRTPQSFPKSAQPKFKRLKQRLKMRVRASEETSNPQLEDDMEDAQPVVTEAQPPQQEDAPAPHSDAPVDEQVSQGNQNKSGLFNRASPMKMFRVCKGFNDDQRKVIVDANLGDVLHWKCNKLIPDLCKYLMGCFNPDTCELDFGHRGSVPTDMQSVVRVLGVPMGSNPFSYCLDAGATRTMLEMFGIKDGKQPTLAFLEKQLGPTHPADDIFLRKFCIYLTCSVFAPTTAIGISPRCYPSLVNTAGIHNVNWPKFIIDILIQTSRAKGTKSWFKACMPYLMILYVDSLDIDSVLEVPEDGTRICVWTNKLVRLAVELDTNSDGSFGKLHLKQCFRIKLSLFSAGPSVIDLFIKTHAPGDHSEDDLAKYRAAISDMCTDFEDGLAKFLKNLSSNSKTPALEGEHALDGEQLNEAQHITTTRGRTSKCTREKVEKPARGEGKVAAGMGLMPDTDESRIINEDNRKRKPTNEVLHTVVGKSKKSKPNQLKESEPLEPIEQHLQSGVDDKGVQFEPVEKVGSEDSRKNTNKYVDKSALGRGALNHLQIYGSGSQSSTEIAPEVGNVKVTKAIQHGEPNCSPKITKRSPSARSSPVLRRPVTRSMSPVNPPSPVCSEKAEPKWDEGSSGIHVPSPQRQTRFATAKQRASTVMYNQLPGSVVDHHGPAVPTKLTDNTSRKLEHDFINTELHSETEQQRRERQRQELIDDCPKFDLGFDDSQDEDVTAQVHPSCIKPVGNIQAAVVSEQQPVCQEEEPVIISSGDSYDKIFSKLPMPTETPVNNKLKEPTSPTSTPNSYTPVPQAHQKRVVKTAAAQKSPFLQVQKKLAATKPTCDVYNKICKYGGKTTDPKNKKKIIDYGHWFIYLRDFADSIKPNGWLSNSTCESALYILSKELVSQKKCVMPLNIATKLRSPNFIEDRSLHKAFMFSDKNRLDHKELILFPTLQDLTPKAEEFTGHYYLISLNLKAERFEVMDSLRSVGTPGLAADSTAIIVAIKQLWAVNYYQSSIDISTFPTVFIATPMQKTGHDCGYFMLKFIEAWDGRRMVHPFSTADMPITRKLMMKKWLEWEENIIAWNDFLFKN